MAGVPLGPECRLARVMKKPLFSPQTCQCGEMSIKGGTAEEVTREWVAMDHKDHHLGRPCGTKLVTI